MAESRARTGIAEAARAVLDVVARVERGLGDRRPGATPERPPKFDRTDITTVRGNEATFNVAHVFQTAILDAMPLAVVAVDREGIVTMWAGAAEELFGWTAEEAIGCPNPIVPEARWAEFRAYLDEELAGVPRDRPLDVVRRRKDGTAIEVSVSASALRNSAGTVIGSLAIIADVTEQKRAERAVRESEERLRVALEGADLGTWDYDLISDMVHWDARCRFLFGVSEGEHISFSRILRIVHDDDRERLQTAIRDALNPDGDGKFDIDYRVVWPDDSVHWVRARGRAFFGDANGPQPIRFIGTVADITEYRRAALKEAAARRTLEAVQRMEALGQMAGGMAHEFNNTLMPIIGLTEMVLDDLPPENPNRSRLEIVHKAALRASETVRRILVFSRDATPKGNFAHPLQPAIEEGIRLLRPAVPPSIDIRTEIAPVTVLTRCAPNDLQQILLNLASNSTAAILPGTGVLTVRLEVLSGSGLPADLPPGVYARLTVSDTGRGMAAETQVRVFEPFFTTKPVGEGTGLGLPVVHGIVSGLGGLIELQSAPGHGTTVTIYLPTVPETAGSADVMLPVQP